MARKKKQKYTSAVVKGATLAESRTLIFSGWKGELKIENGAWGEVKIEGRGLNQTHADVLDYIRHNAIQAGPCKDNAGDYIIFTKLTDYFKLKGIKRDTTTFHEAVKEIMRTTIEITKNGKKYAFQMVNKAGYIQLEKWKEINRAIDVRIGGEGRNKGKFATTGEVKRQPPQGAIYAVRITKEFLQLVDTEHQVNYGSVLPGLLKATELEKKAARFLLSHENWTSPNTPHLASFLWAGHIGESKKTRRRREENLINCADALKSLCGVNYDPETDEWKYIKHPLIQINYTTKKG